MPVRPCYESLDGLHVSRCGRGVCKHVQRGKAVPIYYTSASKSTSSSSTKDIDRKSTIE